MQLLEQSLRKQGIIVGTIATVTPYLYSRASRVEQDSDSSFRRGSDSAGAGFSTKAIGYNIIPSTQFEIEAQGRTVVFAGRGSGHAVGLCQWGTKLADKGYRYDTILRYYFSGYVTTCRFPARAHSVMLLSDFDFPFDPTLIADRPIEPRDQARLLVLSRQGHVAAVAALPISRCCYGPATYSSSTIRKSSSRRVTGRRRPGGGKVELLFVKELGEQTWEVLLKGGKVGQVLDLGTDAFLHGD